jgi:hypothetical protein
MGTQHWFPAIKIDQTNTTLPLHCPYKSLLQLAARAQLPIATAVLSIIIMDPGYKYIEIGYKYIILATW